MTIRALARLAALPLLTAAVLVPATGRAEVTFRTLPGSTAGGQPVSATATFTITAGRVNIQLANLLVNPTSAVQNLNGVQFTLSSGQTAATNLVDRAPILRTIADDGRYTDQVGSFSTTWNLNNDVSGGIELTSLGNRGGSPTLIGAPRAITNTYDMANGSIAGNNPHNPFLAGVLRFDLDIDGLKATDTIRSMRFQFGTASGVNVGGTRFLIVPEPSSVVLMGLGLAGATVAATRLRRRPGGG